MNSLCEWTFETGEKVYGQISEMYPVELARRVFRNAESPRVI
jgi:hypothetical protein